MADLDDLLDEMNDLLADTPPKQKAASPASAKKPSVSAPAPRLSSKEVVEQTGGTNSSTAAEADLDALLAEFGEAPPPRRPSQPQPSPLPPPSRVRSTTLPSASPPSFPSSADNATKMRCSKCDLQVLRFADERWTPDADYMFFRNFMPNVDKLRTKLVASDGYCAWSCQCTWTTVEQGAPHGVRHWFTSRNSA